MSDLSKSHPLKLFFSSFVIWMTEKKVSADGIRPNLTSRGEKNMQNRYSFLSKSKLQGSHAAEHPKIWEELLLIIIVIPENTCFFQSHPGVLQQGGCQKPYAWFLASFYMYLGSGKNPKIQNVKFLANGASTCRDITQIGKYHLLDLKTWQNTKDFALLSGRVGGLLWLSEVSARWSTVCQEFSFFLFRVFSYAENG